MFHVYVLRSLKDGKRYIGFTSNIERRLLEHHSGDVSSTKNRRPLELIYSEDFSNKQEAEEREKFFKSGQGRAELKRMSL
ncbi:MAG: GIY-YIG nuclease family protein [Ignavibacteriaceae bacterium]|nr:GIY-YIG nuclease family protein [Ignavibacteriaceae bacterium]